MPIYRIYVEKKPRFAIEANKLFEKMKESLRLEEVEGLRIIYRYDVANIDIKDFYKATTCVFSDAVVDIVYDKFPDFGLDEKVFACDAIDSRFDADAYTCAQAISVLTGKEAPTVKFAKLYSFKGLVTSDDLNRIKSFIINPLYSKETSLEPLDPIELDFTWPFFNEPSSQIDGFTNMSITELTSIIITNKLDIGDDKILKIQDFYKHNLQRNPTTTELNIISKFISNSNSALALSYKLSDFEFESSKEKATHNEFINQFDFDETKPLTVNLGKAISSLNTNTQNREYIVNQSLNDTFANIDPYVSATNSVSDALYSSVNNNNSPIIGFHFCATVSPFSKSNFTFNPQIQNKVATFSNKIGVPTTFARDIYSPSFSSRPLNIHAYCGTKLNNKQSKINDGDKIYLIGDSISSKSPFIFAEYISRVLDFISTDEVKLFTKKVIGGNLFNEILNLPFGVAVNLDNAIDIDNFDLNIFDNNYLSRIAVIVDKNISDKFEELSQRLGIDLIDAGAIVSDNSLVVYADNNIIADLPKNFIFSLISDKSVKVSIKSNKAEETENANIKSNWIKAIADANCIAQRGISEMYDSHFSGNISEKTDDVFSLANFATICKSDKNEDIVVANSFVSGTDNLYTDSIDAISQVLAKIIAKGGNVQNTDIFVNFGILGNAFESKVSSSVYSAILGIYDAKNTFSFNSLTTEASILNNIDNNVVLSVFGVSKINRKIDFTLKKPNDKIVLVVPETDSNGVPNLNSINNCLLSVTNLISTGKAKAVFPISEFGVSEAIAKMCFASKLGFNFTTEVNRKHLFGSCKGGFLIELDNSTATEFRVIGKVEDIYRINCSTFSIDLHDLETVWISRLNTFYPSTTNFSIIPINKFKFIADNRYSPKQKVSKPKVIIPVFTGTVGHKDLKNAFTAVNGDVEFVYINLSTVDATNESAKRFATALENANILAIASGYTGISEPAGDGELVSIFLKHEVCKEAVTDLIDNRDGLILGVGNGFQALLKTGLLPYGKYTDIGANEPTFTQNVIGRHQAKVISTRVCSNMSPWLSSYKPDDTITVPVSYSNGRFIANVEFLQQLDETGQIATQYIDFDGIPSTNIRYNPANSVCAIEAITSPDGRIFGKMGHSEKTSDYKIFENAINYFK